MRTKTGPGLRQADLVGLPPRADRGPLRRAVGWLALLLVSAFVVAHGCHGPDEDHEPAAVPAGLERE